MAMSSDAQLSRDAHHKQAFLKHLPKRIGGVQRRLRAMLDAGWDINTLHLIFREIQQLAGSAGSYGQVEVSDRLFALEVYLAGFMEAGTVPSDEHAQAVTDLVNALNEFLGQAELAASGMTAPSGPVRVKDLPLDDPQVDHRGLPAESNILHFVRPPQDFLPFNDPVTPILEPRLGRTDSDDENESDFFDPDLERFAQESGDIQLGDLANQLISGDDQLEIITDDEVGESWRNDLDDRRKRQSEESTSSEDETPLFDLDLLETADSSQSADELGNDEFTEESADADVAPESTAGNRGKTIYYLRESTLDSQTLAESLEEKFDVHSFEDPQEFKEILGALGPDAVMIDAAYADQIEQLAPLIKKIRSKQAGPMPLLAFSDDDDLAKRLKIMRAGADAFFRSDTPVEDVRQRLEELLQASVEDPYRILIVEDDRSQAMFAQSILRKAGMKVLLERNPMRVMEALDRFNPDLILMDLYMPDCDGMELTSIIRERAAFINTPIVFLSGESDTDTHFDALLAGGDDFLAKPIRPRHLIQAVTNRVRRARALNKRQQTAAPVSVKSDTLTGLHERPHVLERINALLANPEELDDELSGGVLFVELDSPLDLRQRYGLAGFERIAEELAPLLTDDLRKSDVAARYGDNAYIILMPKQAIPAMQGAAHSLTLRVAKHEFDAGGQSALATVSIGICPLAPHYADAAAVIADAERACNVRSGETMSRVEVHEPQPKAQTDPDAHMEDTIRLALEQRQFQVVYQPIVSLHGDRTERYQMLLRLPSEDGVIPAGEFLPIAERSDLINKIDRWVISRALAIIDERHRVSRPTRLFVNQSVASLRQRENAPWLEKTIETRGIESSCLVLEYKLPDIVDDLKTAVGFCERLRKFGIKICLGAFNGSAEAFQALDDLKVDYVKLPGMASGAKHRSATAMKEAIETLHEKDLRVIIPAIEDARTAANLWSTGVDFIQGNFVQPPEGDLVYQFAENNA